MIARFTFMDGLRGLGHQPACRHFGLLQRIEPRPGDAALLASAWLGHRFEVEQAYADRTPEERERLWAESAS